MPAAGYKGQMWKLTKTFPKAIYMCCPTQEAQQL